MGKLWSYITGKRGTSRVRVYERYPGSPLQVEWYLNGRRVQRSLKSEVGEVIRDKRDAMRIADEMADALEKGHRAKVRQKLFGVVPGKTIGELLGRLHAARERRWSETYTRDQDRFRAFWAGELGADTAITAVNAPMVEDVVWSASDERDWSPATRNRYRRYIVDAFTFAETKLKWIEQRHNLSAVDFEDPKSRSPAYSKDELVKLFAALEEVDLFAGWVAHTLWQTGRRLTAARTLPKAAVRVQDGHTVILWPQETDKAGKAGVSVVVGRAHELAATLHRRPGEYMAGRAPPTLDQAQDWIAEAEERAGIEHVPYRAWHGIKRRYSTATKGLKGRDKQSGTLESTLRRIYEVDDDMDAKRDVAEALAREVGGL